MRSIHTVEYQSATKREGNADTHYDMDEPWGCSAYMRSLDWSDSRRQKVEWWVPGLGGDEEWVFNGCGVSVLGDKEVLEMNGGDGCTTTWISWMPLTIPLKIVSMVNFMFCVFYHNWKTRTNTNAVSTKTSELFGFLSNLGYVKRSTSLYLFAI